MSPSSIHLSIRWFKCWSSVSELICSNNDFQMRHREANTLMNGLAVNLFARRVKYCQCWTLNCWVWKAVYFINDCFKWYFAWKVEISLFFHSAIVSVNANAAAASGLSPAAAVQNAAFLQQLNRTNPVAAALASLPSAVNPSVATNMPTNSVLLVGNLNTEVSSLTSKHINSSRETARQLLC